MIARRGFLKSLAGASASVVLARHVLLAQEASTPPQKDSSNLFAMDQGAAQTVRLPPKTGVKRPSMTAAERDELEHHIRCQCGCTLDVFTCRTTDFSCQVSPAMHRDVMALVEGGYSAQEIIDAFVQTYGERALMAPKKEGFNLLGWAAPFVAIAAGGIVLLALLRKWGARAQAARPAHAPSVDATPDELARVEAAVRREDDE